jgi:hypothetical protein
MTTESEFNRYSIAFFDFEQAVAYAMEAKTHSAATLAHEALLFAAIVSYYRPFSPNEKNKNTPAASQLTTKNFSPFTHEDMSLHEKLKELRNKALAHSEFCFNPTHRNPESGIISSRPFSLLSHSVDIAGLIHLASKLAMECHHKRADHVFRNRQ